MDNSFTSKWCSQSKEASYETFSPDNQTFRSFDSHLSWQKKRHSLYLNSIIDTVLNSIHMRRGEREREREGERQRGGRERGGEKSLTFIALPPPPFSGSVSQIGSKGSREIERGRRYSLILFFFTSNAESCFTCSSSPAPPSFAPPGNGDDDDEISNDVFLFVLVVVTAAVVAAI
mmetsp:Transcript_751/g.1101  ORF Transcript_751/g.1101 Transcript_751/m.1101 type:complete len:175 (+) Transcript_751:530-1054(+)